MSTTGDQAHHDAAEGWPRPTSGAGQGGMDPGEEALEALFPLPSRTGAHRHALPRFPLSALPIPLACFLVTAVPVAVLATGRPAGILVAVLTGLAAATSAGRRGAAGGLVVGAAAVLAASIGVSWPAEVLAASGLAVGVTCWAGGVR